MEFKQKALLVFSDDDKLQFLKTTFEDANFEVIVCLSGENAMKALQSNHPDLILMDVSLSGVDGIETCQLIRKDLNLIQPVIVFLTDRTEDYTQIAAYEAGADDYLPLGIRPRLLLSKINTLLHRKNLCCPPETKPRKSVLVIDESKFMIHFQLKEFVMPKKEFQLLKALAEAKGNVLNRIELMEKVWEGNLSIGDRTIDVHIRKIRERINNDLIRTVKGVGYKLNVEAIIK